MKPVMLKLVSELFRNSRKSDREMARKLGVSQPTVSRMRGKLESEGMIQGEWESTSSGQERRYYSITAKGKEALKGKGFTTSPPVSTDIRIRSPILSSSRIFLT